MTIVQGAGPSGQRVAYDPYRNTITNIANEVALLNLGDFEPLDIKINCEQFNQELQPFNEDWVDYLPRTDRPNNRKGMTLFGLPDTPHNGVPSLAEAVVKLGRPVSELEFNTPTKLHNACTSLHPLTSLFPTLGRTFLVRSDIGGYFVPHRDHPSMPRNVFRLVAFLKNCGPLDYDWLMDDRKLQIEPGRVYYVNTRKTHRTISWVNDSIHLILNVPFNGENVGKVLAHLQHRH